MKTLPGISNAWILLEGGVISDYGTMDRTDALAQISVDEEIDATGKLVLPTWVDSHTHLVYAGNREKEFVDRINGLSYEEIANRGGGILNSARKLQETTADELYEQTRRRLEEVIKMGTGAIEIKSGYGLTPEAELKMLRVIKRLKEDYELPIKATFLGAHAVPAHFKQDRDAYVDQIIQEMIPQVAKEGLAQYIDVFCEKGYFSVEDTHRILEAGRKHGLRPKIHVNQFNSIGGI